MKNYTKEEKIEMMRSLEAEGVYMPEEKSSHPIIIDDRKGILHNFNFLVIKDLEEDAEIIHEFIKKRLSAKDANEIKFIDEKNLKEEIKKTLTQENQFRYLVVMYASNAMICSTSIIEMESKMTSKANISVLDDPIPGMELKFLLAPRVADFSTPPMLIKTAKNKIYQGKYNFNLRDKEIRKKFIKLINTFPGKTNEPMHEMSISSFINFWEEEKAFEYGEKHQKIYQDLIDQYFDKYIFNN